VLLAATTPAFAHEHRVVTVNGRQIEFVVGWVNEPAYADEVNAVDVWAHYINATCPRGNVATSCPVYGLDQNLQVQVMMAGQTENLALSPHLSNDVPPLFYGEYTASLMPTVPGSISFRLSGTINGAALNETFTCGPATFECVDPASEVQFPQQIPSGHEFQAGIGNLRSQVMQLRDQLQTAYVLALAGLVVGIAGVVTCIAGITRSPKKRRDKR
jgi:hypothetical protein